MLSWERGNTGNLSRRRLEAFLQPPTNSNHLARLKHKDGINLKTLLFYSVLLSPSFGFGNLDVRLALVGSAGSHSITQTQQS
jgi:hypothetical protein